MVVSGHPSSISLLIGRCHGNYSEYRDNTEDMIWLGLNSSYMHVPRLLVCFLFACYSLCACKLLPEKKALKTLNDDACFGDIPRNYLISCSSTAPPIPCRSSIKEGLFLHQGVPF
jgi:hypothetical protein